MAGGLSSTQSRTPDPALRSQSPSAKQTPSVGSGGHQGPLVTLGMGSPRGKGRGQALPHCCRSRAEGCSSTQQSSKAIFRWTNVCRLRGTCPSQLYRWQLTHELVLETFFPPPFPSQINARLSPSGNASHLPWQKRNPSCVQAFSVGPQTKEKPLTRT